MVWGDEDPVEIHMDMLHLPQFELTRTNATDCQEGLSTGEICTKKIIGCISSSVIKKDSCLTTQ